MAGDKSTGPRDGGPGLRLNGGEQWVNMHHGGREIVFHFGARSSRPFHESDVLGAKKLQGTGLYEHGRQTFEVRVHG